MAAGWVRITMGSSPLIARLNADVRQVRPGRHGKVERDEFGVAYVRAFAPIHAVDASHAYLLPPIQDSDSLLLLWQAAMLAH